MFSGNCRRFAAHAGTFLLLCWALLLALFGAGLYEPYVFLLLGLVSWTHFCIWNRTRLRHWISAVCMLLLAAGAIALGPALTAAPWAVAAALSAARASGFDVPAYLS